MSLTLRGLAWGLPERGTSNGTRPPFPTRISLHLPLSRGSVHHVIASIAPLAVWLLKGCDGRMQGRKSPLSHPRGESARAMTLITSVSLLVGKEHNGRWALWVDTCARHDGSCRFL